MSLRPVLSSLIAYNGLSSDSSANFGTNLSYRIAHQCAIVCIKIAQDAIDLVHQYKDTQWATTGFIAAWWYNVLFVYSAATVLVATLLLLGTGAPAAHAHAELGEVSVEV